VTNNHTIYPELSFGKFRGIWLDQVFDDAGLTGDETRVMRAITKYMLKGKVRGGKQITPDNRTPRPGNETLKDDAFVSLATVKRALTKAQKRGHLIVKEDGRRSPRILIPVIMGYDPETGFKLPETAQNEPSQTAQKELSQDFDDWFNGVQTNIETAHETAHLRAQKRTVRPDISSTDSDGLASPSQGVSRVSEDKKTYGNDIYSEDVIDSEPRERTKTQEAAHGRWRWILPHFGISESALNGKEQPCPACGGRDRFVFDDRHGAGDYFCRRCDAGKGISLVMKVNGWSYAEAAKRIDELIGNAPRPRPADIDPAADKRKPSDPKLVALREHAAKIGYKLRKRGDSYGLIPIDGEGSETWGPLEGIPSMLAGMEGKIAWQMYTPCGMRIPGANNSKVWLPAHPGATMDDFEQALPPAPDGSCELDEPPTSHPTEQNNGVSLEETF
jgi:hypothetical protein